MPGTHVSRSGYYDWLDREPSPRAQEDERLKVAIRAAHEKTRRTYGIKRLHPELLAEGFVAGRDRIERLRKSMGLYCKQKKAFKITTNSNHEFPTAANVLAQKFTATRPNEVWVTDITYIPTGEGWLYLAGLKDLFNAEIVGYAMGARMTQDLVMQALQKAITNRKPAAGLIHHSDRGSQYCAHQYRQLQENYGIKTSMSRRGNCYDNAPIESFWGSLKNELIHHRQYATRAEAQASIQEYIEVFYNRQRRHSSLGYVSPATFLQHFYQPAAT